MPLLSIENLCVTLGKHRILEEIELQVERGEIVTLVGPMGPASPRCFAASSGPSPRRTVGYNESRDSRSAMSLNV